jgi:hypothetical protein
MNLHFLLNTLLHIFLPHGIVRRFKKSLAMITHFTRIIYPDYRGFDYCGIFRFNNNRDNRGIPVHI